MTTKAILEILRTRGRITLPLPDVKRHGLAMVEWCEKRGFQLAYRHKVLSLSIDEEMELWVDIRPAFDPLEANRCGEQ